ncbi:MAG TPA: hypothetical protein VNT58_10015 [Gaiellaceae bacterium]|nr:hypothetical protein [Gaiellaceae bacterium]
MTPGSIFTRATTSALPRRVADRIGRARIVALVFLLAYAALLLVLGGHSAWGRLGVPAATPTFLDLRSVTTAWECDRRGVAVLEMNPCDPERRPANYPRVWVELSILGLGNDDTVPLGFVLAAIALVAAFAVVPRGAPARDGVVYGAAICSPATMLGLERGNVDVLLFAFLVAAALALRRGGVPAVASYALVFLSAVLKLFPILATGMLLRHSLRARSRWWLLAPAAVVAAFGVYALATLGDIQTIARVVPQIEGYSYGVRPFGVWWSNAVPPFSARVWSAVLLAALLALYLVLSPRLRRLFPPGESSERSAHDLDLFWAGAAIYVCSYALFQNWAYRLIFLLLTLPQLLRWSQDGRRAAVATVALVVATQWLVSPWTGVPIVGWIVTGWDYLTAFRPLTNYRSLSAAATVQLALAAALLAALVATLPPVRIGARRTPAPVGTHRR